jgi:twitching motility protein PilT
VRDVPALTREAIAQFAVHMMNDRQREEFETNLDIDLAYGTPDGVRYRVNLFQQRGSVGMVLRLIPPEVPPFDRLNLAQSVLDLANTGRGIVLVTGATGSGKSTTLAAMIDYINTQHAYHIVTVEDPIEFLHQHKSCIVNQREIGPDATSFAEALRGALRQDPDVILLGEMRDLETIGTALTAAETGHLVFATLHTQDAPSTVDRLIDVFPAAQQEQIRVQIASTLQGIVTQTLLPTLDGKGRVAALEILLPDDAVRNLIRQAKVEQIYSVMQTNTSRGMQTLEQAMLELVRHGKIGTEIALQRSSRPDQLRSLLQRHGFVAADEAGAGGLRVAGA